MLLTHKFIFFYYFNEIIFCLIYVFNKDFLKATIGYIKILKDSLDLLLINLSFLNNLQFLTYNSEHSVIIIF